ncbi:fanconi anemia group A protein [Elysia marginata]|uniref:Fanconi anemia group A protein n=1 Tax=Elysia marginata TaxID=1093978 RepID=A0AAV4JDY7_9GAST|nr:fanconi anemia group A protein [Elysia marginata]
MERFLRATCPSCVSLAGSEDHLVLRTPSLAQQIIKISQEASTQQKPLLTQDQRERLFMAMKHIKLSIGRSCFNQDIFTSMLLRCHLPLEVSWNLYRESVIDLSTFLSSQLKRDEGYKVKLSKSLVALCLGSLDTLRLRQEILSDFVVFLQKQAFCNIQTSTGQLEKQVLNSVLEDILKLSAPCTDENLALPSNFLATSTIVEPQTVHRFAIHSLSLILSFNANKSVADCMKSETEWMSSSTSVILQPMIKEFFLCLNYLEVNGILMRALENQSINSVHIFTYLCALYTCFTEAPTSMKGTII